MDRFARNALRVSLAGTGIVVLAASYVGQASADESGEDTGSTATEAAGSPLGGPTPQAPDDLLAPDSPDSFVLPTVSDIAGR